MNGLNVRFGSKADICTAIGHVRFTPNSDRESEIPQKAMSALAPKADMCGANGDVRFGPIADIAIAKRAGRMAVQQARFCLRYLAPAFAALALIFASTSRATWSMEKVACS